MEIVVATKKRYNLSPSGKLQKQFVTTLREDMKVERKYVDVINQQTKFNGVFFEIDKDKTEAWTKEHNEHKAALKKADDMKKALALAQITNAATTASNTIVENIKPKRTRKPKTETNVEPKEE
ncbi:MAG: hypothetical protein R3279_13455 [Putridiphycobacter sp.]|nr:hypothetical protein [Putridiphycobacter sp.]